MAHEHASGAETPEGTIAKSLSQEGTPSAFSPQPTAVQKPAPPQLTLSTPLFAGSRPASRDGPRSSVGGSALGSHLQSHEHEFAVAEDPSPVLANPTLGLSSLSEALAHLVSFEPRSEHGDSQNASAVSSATAPDDKDNKSPEGGGTAVGSSRCSTALSSETGMTSPSGRSQAAVFSPPSPASNLTAKAVSMTVNDRNEEQRAYASPRPSGSRRPSHIEGSPASTLPAKASPSPATALLQKVNNELSAPSAGPSSGKNSGQNSSNASGLSTPISGPISLRDVKPTVLETHHLQLQTHGPSGRRMINQYVIENELGRGVHGKVRLARDTETGERVAVKIVEREGKRKLGGLAKNADTSRVLRNAKGKEPMYRSMFADDDPIAVAGTSTSTEARKLPDTPGSSNDVSVQHARFAAQLSTGSRGPSSPTSTIGGARFGRWGEGASSRPTFADLEVERQREREREKARKRMLWTTDQKVKREIAIMKKCAHENVVRLKEVIDDPQSKKIFMVLEYMEGGEVRWKDDRGFPTLTVDETRKALRDVVLGLEYLHYQGIIHRDIKPANLLCDAERRVKISDFGVSHFSYAMLVARGGLASARDDDESDDPSLVDDRELAKTAGSPAFFAPELCMASDPSTLPRSRTMQDNAASGSNPAPESVAAAVRQKRPTVSKAIDVWALGVTLYCLLFGHVPFTADSEYALFSVIAKEDYALPTYMGADRVLIGPRKKRWVATQAWTDEEGDVDPDSSRDDAHDVDEALLGEEARLVRDLLDRLLEKDPAKRIKLDEVKKHPWLVQDIADPPAWLNSTDPTQLPFVQVSHEEVQSALTGFSKLKQTMKRLQAKVMTALGAQHADAQWSEASNGPRGRVPLYERRNQHSRFTRRPRSNSASLADGEGRPDIKQLLQMQESRQTGPRSANVSAEVSAQASPSAYMSQSTRGRFPFVRRRSVMLDAIKQDLEAMQASPVSGNLAHEGCAAHNDGVSGVCSQANSPEIDVHGQYLHSPSQMSRDITDSSLVWVEGGAQSIPSAEMLGSKSGKRPHRFFKRALSRPSQTSQHSDKLVVDTSSLSRHLPTQGSGRSRVSSQNSGRAGESTFMRATMSAGASGDMDEGGFASGLGSRQSSSGRIQPPSRQRSRSRLGEVFRHVWHVPLGKHVDADARSGRRSGDTWQSAETSRPEIAASQVIGHAHSGGMLDVATDQTQHHGSAGIDMTPAGLSPAVSPAQIGVFSQHALAGQQPSYFEPAVGEVRENRYSAEADAEAHDDRHRSSAVNVDEYDVDLELSDDESDDASNMHGGQPLLHLNQSGWVTQRASATHAPQYDYQQPGQHDLHTIDSLTPSVEGGYNIFKPPYVGKFERTDPNDAAGLSHANHQVRYEDEEGEYADDAAAHEASGYSQDHDVTGVSDDRFADADETDDDAQRSDEHGRASGDGYAMHYHQEALTEAERSYAPHAQPYMDGRAESQDGCEINTSHSKGGGSLPTINVRAAKPGHSPHGQHESSYEGEDDNDDDEEDGLNFKARRTATTG